MSGKVGTGEDFKVFGAYVGSVAPDASVTEGAIVPSMLLA